MADKFNDVIIKIADKINKKRRQELLTYFFTDTQYSKYIKKVKEAGVFEKGSKSKVWRKIAEMPIEVDQFFTKMFGKDYFKDKNFFKKFPEWLVVKDL